MPLVQQTFTFTIENNAECWTGVSPSPFEVKLATAMSSYPIEQLRLRFMHAVTTNHEMVKSVRTAVQMAFDTEIGVTLEKVIDVPTDVFTSLVCERRRFLDVDEDLQLYRFMIEPALADAVRLGVLPIKYADLLRTHINSNYPRYRICALAALLCHAAQALTP